MSVVLRVERCVLETEYWPFRTFAFLCDDGRTQLALVAGADLESPGDKPVPLLRVQSHCLTSTALGSTMCDCAHQIDAALRRLTSAPSGVMLYLDQEARGHGLFHKIRVMAGVNNGLTLRGAQLAAGVGSDARTYEMCPPMLAHIGCDRSVDLLTDSPGRAERLRRYGIAIRRVIPLKDTDTDD